MGVVYRATDSKLGREVALKMLSPAFAQDPERLARFTREAQVLASLNHAGIAAIYGVEEQALVIELVEGPTLAERIARGPMPLDEALPLIHQLIDAIEYAHEKAVIHRDLKPANIKLTGEDGDRVKVLDFGLAKALVGDPAGASLPDQANSPTMTMKATQAGVILGTVGYMAPEQARGKNVDRRADVWSFGVIVWEMLTGRSLFAGETLTDTLSRVLTAEIDLQAAPEAVRPMLRRCLERDPRARLRDIGDAREWLKVQPPSPAAAAPRRRSWLIPLACGLLIGLAGFGGYLLSRPASPLDLSKVTFRPIATDVEIEDHPNWSHDGQMLAYLKDVNGVSQVIVRALGQPVATQLTYIPGGVWTTRPFFSPNGELVYLIAEGGLFSVPVLGGEPVRVLKGSITGGAISPDGKVLAVVRMDVAKGQRTQAVWISSPPGAEPRRYAADSLGVAPYTGQFLSFSRSGTAILLVTNGPEGFQAWKLPWPDGDGAKPMRLDTGSTAQLGPGGGWFPDSRHFVYSGMGQIRLGSVSHLSGQALVSTFANRLASPSASPDGRRVAFTSFISDLDIVSFPVDGGEPRPVIATSQPEGSPSWSADGSVMAYFTWRTGQPEVWLRNAEGTWDRPVITGAEMSPTSGYGSPSRRVALSPDGHRIAYRSGQQLFVTSTSGGKSVPLGPPDTGGFSWSPDSLSLVALRTGESTKRSVVVLRVGGRPPERVLASAVLCSTNPSWFPDGRWIACGSDDRIELVSPDGMTRRTLSSPFRTTPQSAVVWARHSNTIWLLSSPKGETLLGFVDVPSGSSKTIRSFGTEIDLRAPGSNWAGSGTLSPDGKSILTTQTHLRSDIWLMEGLNLGR